MKKYTALILALLFIACFAGCRETGGTADDTSSTALNTSSISNEYEVIEGGTGGIDTDNRESGEDDFDSSSTSSGEDGSSSAVSDPSDIVIPDSGTSTVNSGSNDDPDVP